jgi:hypothetical protein
MISLDGTSSDIVVPCLQRLTAESCLRRQSTNSLSDTASVSHISADAIADVIDMFEVESAFVGTLNGVSDSLLCRGQSLAHP